MARSTKPEKGNKYFNTKNNGGYSTCIKGSPTDIGCNVLANCVGYACGAFNEAEAKGKETYNLNCNAENFIERAISLGLSVVQEPVVGGIMVWRKGATLSGSDGAGHVAYVYKKVSSTQVKTSDSSYGGSAFLTLTRNKDNGNWGAGTGYIYRGCIVPPSYKMEQSTSPTVAKTIDVLAKEVIAGKWGNGEARKTALTKAGHDYSKVQTRVNEMLSSNSSSSSSTELKKGDKVKIAIKSSGYSGSADGKYQNSKRYKTADGWTRTILVIHSGKAFPYQVGSGNVTTGFFKAEDLKKIK